MFYIVKGKVQNEERYWVLLKDLDLTSIQTLNEYGNIHLQLQRQKYSASSVFTTNEPREQVQGVEVQDDKYVQAEVPIDQLVKANLLLYLMWSWVVQSLWDRTAYNTFLKSLTLFC